MNVIAPWYYPNRQNPTVKVVAYGHKGHTLSTIDHVSVTFSGSTDYSFQVEIPAGLYANDTEGVCGNSNGNKHDDPICPDGGSINTCWERHHKTTTQAPPTTKATTSPTIGTTTASQPICDPATQQQIDQECSIIVNENEAFAICALNATDLAATYYASCIYDLCVANDSTAICDILQSYADACMQAIPNITLDWRSEAFCRK